MGTMATAALLLTLVCLCGFAAERGFAVDVWEHNSLDYFAKPGPYGMGTMIVNAPKASIFRQSMGTAPVSVYFPTLKDGAASSNNKLPPAGTFHAIGFAHGAGSVAEMYTGLYEHMVSHGFIIVSVRNMAPIPATLGDDMCHGLAWIITESLGKGPSGPASMFYNRVNTTGVGAMGHSMGGGGSVHCATSWPQKVKAVAPIHPAPGAPATLIYTPMMVPTGALDFVTSPMMVKMAVYDGSPSPKLMPVMNGVGHREPVNFAGGKKWDAYLAAFFSSYLRSDLGGAMVIWGDETGSVAKDSRISNLHSNKGAYIQLEAAEASFKPGQTVSIPGKLVRTLPLTKEAPYTFSAYRRIAHSFDVDAKFEVKEGQSASHEVDFVLHLTPKTSIRGSREHLSSAGKRDRNTQKLTIAARNLNDGGSAVFHNVHLTLIGSPDDLLVDRGSTDWSQYSSYFSPPSSDSRAVSSISRGSYFQGDSKVEAFDDSASKEWDSLVSGTKYSPTKDSEMGTHEQVNRESHSWADMLYSSSKSMQRDAKGTPDLFNVMFQNNNDNTERPTSNSSLSAPAGSNGQWMGQLFPVPSRSSVPTSLLPWSSIGRSNNEFDDGIVLGVEEYPLGYGDAKEGRPTHKDRQIMMWINTMRASPQAFEGAYPTRGCSFASFEAEAKTPQEPLHYSHTLSESAYKHSWDMSNDDFVSHIGSDSSTPFERMDSAGYEKGYRGENIAAGMKHPFDVVVSWMCSDAHRENVMAPTFKEMGMGVSTNLGSRYQNYWTLNLGHSGSISGGSFVSDFTQNVRNYGARATTMGVHRPEEPIDEVTFVADFHDARNQPPRQISVFANGIEFPLELKYGQTHHGIYEQTIQLLSIPMWQVLGGSSPCIAYHFRSQQSSGKIDRFPELGSYGFGGCNFDDDDARWMNHQNETVTGMFNTQRSMYTLAPQASSRGQFFASSRSICLTDTHRCANGDIVNRQSPSCQFICQSGDPVHKPTDMDFLLTNKQSAGFGGVNGCASTWAQFWSGTWHWCPEVLDEAWNNQENQWRWLIPLWKEVQRIDWVAAANAMTEFWQNMQQCKTYKPDGAVAMQQEGSETQTVSSIRIGHGNAISNMQRVIVRSNVDARERLTNSKLHLRYRYVVNQVVVQKSILLGDANALGSADVIFDDFAGAPMPGWWGSWFETIALTAWNDLEKLTQTADDTVEVELVERFALIGGNKVPILSPQDALIHFTESSSSEHYQTAPSSAGIWELVLTHEDPVSTGAEIKSWDLMICGEPVSQTLNFSSEANSCTENDNADAGTDTLHLCGSVSTVGGYSKQPPPPLHYSTNSNLGAFSPKLFRIGEVSLVHPLAGESMFCSKKPLTQQAWTRPRYDQSGLELGLYLFHHPDYEYRKQGAWRLAGYDVMDLENGKTSAAVSSRGPAAAGCWIWYVVSKRGAGPYDFWMKSSPA
eukprot:CAMPEP_0198234168 /NCGR_PEP_ID=MMETSP1446-20131203/249_1 /TAXON_ID=1461542 ORGANISM="Unidentified sp, Strain CCMP2111" /NCGR_SAMPLE_ID=MMETSP1446 /ASSEMBLY_ACC=CAM_ASM_001112 /LENGTH=1438 /DNA_ID=CAMNT_0043914905 /DNA_START=172 /DNA_END=4488 /DNA_ORIENTATION=+